MSKWTGLGRLAFRHTVRPDKDFNPVLATRNIPTLSYAEGGALVLPRNYRAGLVTSVENTDDVNIAVGMCRDSSDAKNIRLETTITKMIDATWAIGDDAGGLNATDFASGSSGTEPNTTYHVYLIKKTGAITGVTQNGADITCAAADHVATVGDRITISGTFDYDGDYTVTAIDSGVSFDVTATFTMSQTGTFEQTDAGFDKSTSAANLLSDSGFSHYRRVASVTTDDTAAPNANILDYVQVGNLFQLKDPTSLAAADQYSAGTITIDMASKNAGNWTGYAGAPVGFQNILEFNYRIDEPTAWQGYFSSLDVNDETASLSVAPLASREASGAVATAVGKIDILSDTSAQIRLNLAGGSGTFRNLDISLLGWYDFLGDYD
jgi:hypothetical protein